MQKIVPTPNHIIECIYCGKKIPVEDYGKIVDVPKGFEGLIMNPENPTEPLREGDTVGGVCRRCGGLGFDMEMIGQKSVEIYGLEDDEEDNELFL